MFFNLSMTISSTKILLNLVGYFVYNFLYNILIACMALRSLFNMIPRGIWLDLIRASCIMWKFDTTWSFCLGKNKNLMKNKEKDNLKKNS